MKKCLKTLFIGGRDGFSMGRTAFWLVLGCMLYRFMRSGQDITDIPPGFLTFLTVILGYTLGGKYVSKIGPVEFKDKENDGK
jgi:hypothetical protein